MNIDEMPAGPQMDRLIATLMGDDIEVRDEHQWRKDEHGEIDRFAMEYENHNGPMCERCDESYCVHCDKKPSKKCAPTIPDYSGHIIHAWGVAEKLRLMVFPCKSGWAAATVLHDTAGEGPQHGGHWIDDSLDHYATAPTAALAICRAALKAKGAP